MSGRKAMSMPMEIIIAVVVLVVIALAVIMMTTGSITKFGTDSGNTGTSTANSIQCKAEKMSWCNDNPGGTCTAKEAGKCPSCITSVKCAGSASTSSSTTSASTNTQSTGGSSSGGIRIPVPGTGQ